MLAVLLKYVPQLRDQGVYELKIDGIELHLRGMPQAESAQAPEMPPGRDPVTYGLPAGMKLPSLRERHG